MSFKDLPKSVPMQAAADAPKSEKAKTDHSAPDHGTPDKTDEKKKS